MSGCWASPRNKRNAALPGAPWAASPRLCVYKPVVKADSDSVPVWNYTFCSLHTFFKKHPPPYPSLPRTKHTHTHTGPSASYRLYGFYCCCCCCSCSSCTAAGAGRTKHTYIHINTQAHTHRPEKIIRPQQIYPSMSPAASHLHSPN